MTDHRDLMTVEVGGREVKFIASNDRLTERVENLSHEKYMLDAILERIESDEVFWDVGACLGIHTITVAAHVTDGAVVGFEPMPANRGVLTDNIHTNDLGNVRVSRSALADNMGTIQFAVRGSFDAGYSRHSIDTGEYEKLDSIEVPVARGDALIGERYPIPNVVKIDVEGASPLVLEGMKHVLRRDECHTVLVETHEPNSVQPSHEDFGYTEADIVSFLEGLGFTVSTLEKEYHLIAESELAATTGNHSVEVVKDDIANRSVDAIVNAAGTSLRMGSGVSGSLRSVAGDELNQVAVQEGPISLGSAVVTDAFGLDAECVVHAAAMPHYDDGMATVDSIRASVRHALQLADEQGCGTVALPAVGCGLAGVDLSEGASVIMDELRSFNSESVECIEFVAYTQDEYEIIEHARQKPTL